MNLHPIFVHFPIAFFTLYFFFEVLRTNRFQRPFMFYIRAVLVIAGTLGALAALQTGDMASEALRSVLRADPVLRATRSWHENFADISTSIFGFLAVMYLVAWADKDTWFMVDVLSPAGKFWNWLVNIANQIINGPWAMILAILGFIAITITGGLGGIMVYGDKADPFFAFFYHLFVK